MVTTDGNYYHGNLMGYLTVFLDGDMMVNTNNIPHVPHFPGNSLTLVTTDEMPLTVITNR